MSEESREAPFYITGYVTSETPVSERWMAHMN